MNGCVVTSFIRLIVIHLVNVSTQQIKTFHYMVRLLEQSNLTRISEKFVVKCRGLSCLVF